jgi:D-sedoheptulose 7-phosphate isomerase
MKNWIENYIAAQKAALETVPPEQIARAIETVKKAWKEERQIFCIGNGGSAANSSHFATDLGKGSSDKMPKRFKVMSLTDNLPWITAIGNDYAYEDIFLRQLQNYAKAGDLLIAVSVSGNSPNCVKAMQWAAANQIESIALVGGKRGQMAKLGSQVIVVEDTHYGRVEDVQMHILHMICYAFMEQVA